MLVPRMSLAESMSSLSAVSSLCLLALQEDCSANSLTCFSGDLVS